MRYHIHLDSRIKIHSLRVPVRRWKRQEGDRGFLAAWYTPGQVSRLIYGGDLRWRRCERHPKTWLRRLTVTVGDGPLAGAGVTA